MQLHLFFVETLIRVIKRYSINIYTSNTKTTGDWRSLDKFDQLTVVFTPLGRNRSGRWSAANDRFIPFPGATACESRLTQICQGMDEDYSSDGPMPAPIWFAKKRMNSLRGCMLDDKVIHYYLSLLCSNGGSYWCNSIYSLWKH